MSDVNNKQNRSQLIDVARMYYEDNLTQSDIAEKTGFSRPKVSRMLAESRELGYVKFYIVDDLHNSTYYEKRFLEAFKLDGIKIIQVPSSDNAISREITIKKAAEYIIQFVNDGDTIGVGWGDTLLDIAKNLPYLNLRNCNIVQLCGNIDDVKSSSKANEIIQIASEKFSAQVSMLPCPAVVDSPIICEVLAHDAKTNQILMMAKNADVMLANIALPDTSSCLARTGYLKTEDLKLLKEKDAAGSICCRYYNQNGEVCDSTIDNRTIAVKLEDIKKAPCVIICATSPVKATALLGALRGGLINVLVLDAITANEILTIYDSEL